jgi:hypothetical protein
MASRATGREFAFAGGSSMPDQITFIAVANPGDDPVEVNVEYLFAGGHPPIVRQRTLEAHGRLTFASYDNGADGTGVPAGRTFGVRITTTGPVIAQKVMIDVRSYHAMPAGAEGPGP